MLVALVTLIAAVLARVPLAGMAIRVQNWKFVTMAIKKIVTAAPMTVHG